MDITASFNLVLFQFVWLIFYYYQKIRMGRKKMKKLLPVGLVLLACMLIFTACGGEKNTTTDVPATTEDSVTMEAPGLYDANNNLIASWDELVNTYGMRVDVDYDSFPEKIGTTSPYYLFTEISALQNGVKLVLGNVTSIGNRALACCTSLTSVTIPDSVTSIGEYAFNRCTSFTSVHFNGTKTQWEAVHKVSWDYNTGDYTIYCTDGNITK